MVFDKSVSDPANITISEDFDFLYRLITSGFYRVLCKSAMGGGEVFVCRLRREDSNFYLDGSPADLTGQEGDVMVVFLEFWYKWYKVDDNKFLYHFADHNIDGTYIHVPQSLVGAYKGKEVYVMGERGYLSRTSRPRNAFSPPYPLRWKTGNAFLPQTHKLSDYQSLI